VTLYSDVREYQFGGSYHAAWSSEMLVSYCDFTASQPRTQHENAVIYAYKNWEEFGQCHMNGREVQGGEHSQECSNKGRLT